MGQIFQPLLFLFVRCTRNQLIGQIEFLRAENEMLRRRVPQKLVMLSAEERSRLLKLAEGNSRLNVRQTIPASFERHCQSRHHGRLGWLSCLSVGGI